MRALLPFAIVAALAAGPAAASAKTLVSFGQSGGFAGVDLTATVSTTGYVTGDFTGHDHSHRLRAAVTELLRISRGGR